MQPPTTTHNHPQLPTTTHNHPQPPKKSPTTIHNHPEPSTTIQKLLKKPRLVTNNDVTPL